MNDDGKAKLPADLACHSHIPQILEILAESGCNTAFLVRIAPVGGADLTGALRLMAAYGLLAADRAGSWDDALATAGTLRLTRRGEAIAAQLSTGPALDDAPRPAVRPRIGRRDKTRSL